MNKDRLTTNSLFEKPVIINIGLDIFTQSLDRQGAEVVHVTWKPVETVNGDDEIQRILEQLM